MHVHRLSLTTGSQFCRLHITGNEALVQANHFSGEFPLILGPLEAKQMITLENTEK